MQEWSTIYYLKEQWKRCKLVTREKNEQDQCFQSRLLSRENNVFALQFVVALQRWFATGPPPMFSDLKNYKAVNLRSTTDF